MAEYTYAQIAQMQKEAEQRVKEMRLRAKLAAEDAHRRFDADDIILSVTLLAVISCISFILASPITFPNSNNISV